MIREYCDQCGKEFKWPDLKCGTITFKFAYATEVESFDLCGKCFNAWRDAFVPEYSKAPTKVDIDDEMYDAYEANQKRVLENDEMSGERI